MIIENDIPKPRKASTPRKPAVTVDGVTAPKRGLGQAITRQRRKASEALAEQQRARRERERESARGEMNRLRVEQRNSRSDYETRWGRSLLQSVVSNQTALLRSWGFKQPVLADLGSFISASTNFRSIRIVWPVDSIPAQLDTEAVLDTIAQMKGVMQHEMGHLRFTIPFDTLLTRGVVGAGVDEGSLQRCWNLLEDQRMEANVVREVPRIARYFATMIFNIVLGGQRIEQGWLFLAGRHYLPTDVLRLSAQAFDEWAAEQGVIDGAKTWADIVQRYCTATTEADMVAALLDGYVFLSKLRANLPPSNHSTSGNPEPPSAGDTATEQDDVLSQVFDESDDDEQDTDEQGSSSEGDNADADDDDSDGDSDSDGDTEGDGSDDSEGAESQVEPNADTESDRQDDKASTKGEMSSGKSPMSKAEQMKESIEQATGTYQQEMRADADVQEMMRTAAEMSVGNGLPDYVGEPTLLSQPLITAAEFISAGIESALNTFITECQPVWRTRQDEGIIDPLAYRTKNVGDRNFRREFDDRGNSGLDVHVSMLCDVSTSMSGTPMTALSQALYAMALGCQRVNVGATYTLWSSQNENFRVWRDGNISPSLWPAMGGTDPVTALDDLAHHNEEGAANHLVIIFTDGEWHRSFQGLQRWAQPNRRIVLVKYGTSNTDSLGADVVVNIKQVEELPTVLTHALIDTLASLR